MIVKERKDDKKYFDEKGDFKTRKNKKGIKQKRRVVHSIQKTETMPGKTRINEKGCWKWYLAQNVMTEVCWMLATNFDVPGREPARTDIISTISFLQYPQAVSNIITTWCGRKNK